MKKITREEANEIIKDQMGKDLCKCVICWHGQWYDVRGMSDVEIDNFCLELFKANP